jgi:DNA-directed RNA polymerase specialized sigma24 family protein
VSASQSFLSDYEPDLSELTPEERDAYEACVLGGTGVREYARETNRSPGTVGNLLARAREKVPLEA